MITLSSFFYLTIETLNNITKVCVKNTFASTLPIAALGGSVAGVLILILLIISGVGVLGFLFIRNRRFKTIDMVCFMLSATDAAADVV